MSAQDITGPIIPSTRQRVHICVCTKIRFQSIIRNLFEQERLATINASVNPFVLPIVIYSISLDVYIFVLL